MIAINSGMGANLSFSTICSATGKTDINDYAIAGNPVNLIKTESAALSFSFSPSKFNMPELSPGCAIYSQRLSKSLVAGLSVQGLGNVLYSEISGMLHTSYSIDSSISIAASLEYSRITVKNYSSDHSFKVHVGGLLVLTDYLTAGFSLRNITGSYYYGGEQTAGRTAVFGFDFSIIEPLNIEISVVMATNTSSGLSVSARYDLVKMIYLHFAYLTNPMTIESGIAFQPLKYFKLTVGLNYLRYLGYSQQYGVSLYW